MKTSTGRPPEINRLEILKKVNYFRFLTVNQCRAIFGKCSFTEMKEILFGLWRHDFLGRLVLTRAAKKIFIFYVFSLSRKGARQLAEKIGAEKIFFLKPNDKRSSLFLEHALLLNDFRICLELLSNKTNDTRLIVWTHDKRDLKIRLNSN